MILLATGTLINGSTWHDSLTLTKPSGTTLTLSTQQQYTDKNIQLTLNAQTASVKVKGGALVNKTASATFNNATVSSTDTSGISIQTQGSAGRMPVYYNGTINGWVNAANNSVCSNEIPSSSWNGQNYYLTGVTLGLGKSFDIAIPNGDGSGYIALRFMVDSLGNTTVVTANDSATIPTASASDDGKILEVINGVWTKTNIENAMGGEY